MDTNCLSQSFLGSPNRPAVDRDSHALTGRWRAFAQSFAATRRRFGWSSALLGLVYRIARRLGRMEIGHVFGVELAKLSPSPNPTKTKAIASLTFRFLTAKEVRELATDPANDLDANLAERIDGGRDFCFAAFEGSRLASYSWYALNAAEREDSLGIGLSFPDDAVYLYKAFTHPDFRGRNIHPAAVQNVARVFLQRGLSRLIAIVEFANWPSIRSHERLGFQRVGRILKLGVRPLRWERLSIRDRSFAIQQTSR